MNKLDPNFIHPRRRDLFLRVNEGFENISGGVLTQCLHFLDDRFPEEKLNRALLWLINQRLVGANFVKWFREECHNSHLQMHAKLLHVVDNLPTNRIIAGKNFNV